MMHYPFLLPPLPYEDDALEPYLQEKTVRVHHGERMTAAVHTLNALLRGWNPCHLWSLRRLASDWATLPATIREGVGEQAESLISHALYFEGMTRRDTVPTELLQCALKREFDGKDGLRCAMRQAERRIKGDGWLFLCAFSDGSLQLVPTEKNRLPQGEILLALDLWEHAYAADYPARRDAYLSAWFDSLVDWDCASRRYEAAVSRPEA